MRYKLVKKTVAKGIVNLGKLLSGVGVIVGGGLDLVETKIEKTIKPMNYTVTLLKIRYAMGGGC